jgi:hypothetical protein
MPQDSEFKIGNFVKFIPERASLWSKSVGIEGIFMVIEIRGCRVERLDGTESSEYVVIGQAGKRFAHDYDIELVAE